ncbi:Hypothetical predicted protein [Cloeon dipterum]|uniref:Uncharacterized protein n=1 Tax=Cloeon dipterum TaxID=197152 RepID=A0A8S1CE94_9INSE|nr:Hypothetical predicted protein [Cloeon dipterum]
MQRVIAAVHASQGDSCHRVVVCHSCEALLEEQEIVVGELRLYRKEVLLMRRWDAASMDKTVQLNGISALLRTTREHRHARTTLLRFLTEIYTIKKP